MHQHANYSRQFNHDRYEQSTELYDVQGLYKNLYTFDEDGYFCLWDVTPEEVPRHVGIGSFVRYNHAWVVWIIKAANSDILHWANFQPRYEDKRRRHLFELQWEQLSSSRPRFPFLLRFK